MAEFSRLSLMVDKDLSASLQSHHNKILEVGDLLERNLKRLLGPLLAGTHTRELEVEVAHFRRTTSMNLLLPLALLDCAREDLKKFLEERLKELSTQKESQEPIGALVERLSNLQGHTWKVLESSNLLNPQVSL